MKLKRLITAALVTTLGWTAPTVLLPQPSVAQAFTGIRVKTDKLLTVRVVNESGKSLMYGLSQNKPQMLANEKAGVMPFSQIKTMRGEVNILVYTPDGSPLTFKGNYNAETNELTVNVTPGTVGHRSISIGPDGIVELI